MELLVAAAAGFVGGAVAVAIFAYALLRTLKKSPAFSMMKAMGGIPGKPGNAGGGFPGFPPGGFGGTRR